MALKVLITKEEYEALPEAVQKEYSEQAGSNGESFMLDTDDSSFKVQISEFRNNNIALIKEKDSLQEQVNRFKDIDPEKYQEAVDKLREIEEKELVDKGDVEQLVAHRTERMKSDYEGQIKSLNDKVGNLTAEKEKSDSHLSRVLIDSEAQQAVTSVGAVRQGAMTDVLSRARGTFKLRDGVPVPEGPDGKTLYGSDGNTPLTIGEWAKGLLEEAPYLFENSSGGGAGGGESGAGGGSAREGEVASGDKQAFSDNLEDIAKGKVKVV